MAVLNLLLLLLAVFVVLSLSAVSGSEHWVRCPRPLSSTLAVDVDVDVDVGTVCKARIVAAMLEARGWPVQGTRRA